MRTDGNLGATTAYNPNSQGLWDNQPEYVEPPLTLEGDASHYDHRLEDDHWEQPGNLFRKMTPEQQQLLFDNTARAIRGASQEVLEQHVANCRRADPAYGRGAAEALNIFVREDDLYLQSRTAHVNNSPSRLATFSTPLRVGGDGA